MLIPACSEDNYVKLQRHARAFRSIYPSTCLSIYLPTYPSIYPCIHVSVDLSVDPSIDLSIYLSICLSVPVCLSVSVCLCLSLSVSVCLCLSLSVCVCLCLSVCLSLCPSLAVGSSVCIHEYLATESLYVCVSVYLPTYLTAMTKGLCINLSTYPSTNLLQGPSMDHRIALASVIKSSQGKCPCVPRACPRLRKMPLNHRRALIVVVGYPHSQLTFQTTQIPSNRDHKAINRGALGA